MEKTGEAVTTFPTSKLTVPFSAIGVSVFGDNLAGQAVDFFNPMSDIQNIVDLFQGGGDE